PWLAGRLRRAQVLVNVAGRTIEDYVQVVQRLDPLPGFLAFELNLSCPNVEEGGAVFSTREDLLDEVIRTVRPFTRRPLIAKLAPNVPDIGRMAEVAVGAGADGLTLINTFPGLLFDLESRRPVVGAGSGGVIGPAILPMGVYAVWRARQRVYVPIIGAGGIRSGADALQYLLARPHLVEVGTALVSDPRTPRRV